MDLLKWFRRPKPEEKRAITSEQFKALGLYDGPSFSGLCVTEQSALTLSCLYRGARVISEAVGGMPLKLYRRTNEGREEAKDHRLYGLLKWTPNEDTGAVEFFTQLMFWAVLFGNGYAEIERDGAGAVTGLYLLDPRGVTLDYVGNRLVYRVGEVTLQPSDVFHLKGPSLDGTEGCRLVQLARESFGYSMALERFGSAYFGNGARLGGTLEYPDELTDNAREVLRTSFAKAYQGVENAGKWAVLENGVKATPFSTNNEASQFIESRQFQVTEICRWIGIDPIFLFDYSRATWNNAEHQTRNFLLFSVNPWLKKIEEGVSLKLLLPNEREDYYAEFTREAIVQLDVKTQTEVWATGVDKGWYTVDEVRSWLNLAPLPEPEPAQEPQAEAPAEDNGEAINLQ
jgi:HK97 family phage portal protein